MRFSVIEIGKSKKKSERKKNIPGFRIRSAGTNHKPAHGRISPEPINLGSKTKSKF